MSGGTRSYEMARRFVCAGHEVHIISSCREKNCSDKNWWTEIIEGIHVHWISIPYSNKLTYSQRIRAFIRFAWLAARKAHQVGGDIVFATSTPLTIALPGIYASKRLNVPMVFEVRDLWPELPVAIGALRNPFLIKLAKWLEMFAYRHSTRIVALSPGMAAGVEATGYPVEKISVIPNGADVDLFRVNKELGDAFLAEHPNLSGGPLVVYAGTLGVINGVGYLVDIAALMKNINPTVRFLIVGDGKESVEIEQKASDLNVLGENLWMLPPVSKNEMPALLSAATVATSLFVDLPEMWNNSANKFFDALAAGKPIMINYQGWQAQLLEENGAGIVVPPDSPERAAKMLNGLLCDVQLINDAQTAAKQLAEVYFNRDILATQLLTLLEQTNDW